MGVWFPFSVRQTLVASTSFGVSFPALSPATLTNGAESNPGGLHGLVFLPVCLAVMGPSVTQAAADPRILAPACAKRREALSKCFSEMGLSKFCDILIPDGRNFSSVS